MKILYLVPHVPNPTKVRSYNQVRGLLEAGHHVTVATLICNTTDEKYIQRLNAFGVETIAEKISKPSMLLNALRCLPSQKPFQSSLFWSSPLMKRLLHYVQEMPPDIIHVEHLRMAKYGLELLKYKPTIWDAVDNLTSLFSQAATRSDRLPYRIAASVEAHRLSVYEQQLTGKFPRTLVISDGDRDHFQRNNPFADRIYAVAFGLPMNALPDIQHRQDNCLIMTGTLNYRPNIASAKYFIKEIFPLIQRHFPETKLQLVGAHPHPSIQALVNNSIEVTGFVESIGSYLLNASIALAPVVYGSGVQIKVLEAFMTGTPLVATSIALRGLEVKHEEHVLIADSPEKFADAVIRLLQTPELREKIGRAGRLYVEEHHDLRKTTDLLISQYKALI